MARLSPLSLQDATRIPSGDADLSDYYAEFAADQARIRDERQAAYLASRDPINPFAVKRPPRRHGPWIDKYGD